MPSIGPKPTPKPLCAIALVAAALSIAACGSSSSTPATTNSTAAATAARRASARVPYRDSKAGRDVVSTGVVTHRPLDGTGGGELNDDNPGHADTGDRPASGRDPCELVSRAQAEAIVGRPIGTPVDAPLGPTCIYEASGAKNFITVAVAASDFATIERYIHNPTRSTIAGRPAYCGAYGRPTTFVPLGPGRVLTIAAPCTLGARFAAAALRRL